jgi:dolichol-phosphate mannosyltransferase
VPDVAIVVPTYNERENLAEVTAAMLAALPEASVLVVDDASPDGTGALADELARADGRIAVLHRPGKAGLAAAYVAGFGQVLRDPAVRYVVQMDADFSHDPRALPALLAPVRDGECDFAIGSRWVAGGGTRHWGVGRQLISRGGSVYASLVLGVRVRDITAGFKCWRRAALEDIDLGALKARGFGFQIEMTWRALQRGWRAKEVPIVFSDRTRGASKMSRAIFVEALGLVWKLRLGR